MEWSTTTGRGHSEPWPSRVGVREREGIIIIAVGMGTFIGVGVGVAGVVSDGTTQRLASAWAERPY